MTGNSPILPQVLGASTVAGAAAVALPLGGGSSIFSIFLIGIIAIAVAIVIVRCIKIFKSKKI